MPTYLIHFDRNFRHARHYVGFTDDLDKRIALHRKGRGAKLLAAVNISGIGWQVVKVWLDGRGREKAIKRQKKHSSFLSCLQPKLSIVAPFCQGVIFCLSMASVSLCTRFIGEKGYNPPYE